MKATLITIGIIAGLVLLAAVGSALNLITIPWLQFDSKVQANRDIVTQTYNANNELYNYHYFQETAADIKTAEQNIQSASTSLAAFEVMAGAKPWDFQTETQDGNLRTVLQGNIQYYNGLVNTYNAKAGEVDKSMFVNGLPLYFNLQ